MDEVIREEYNLGLRRDVVDEEGKQQHGWIGFGLLPRFVVCKELSSPGLCAGVAV